MSFVPDAQPVNNSNDRKRLMGVYYRAPPSAAARPQGTVRETDSEGEVPSRADILILYAGGTIGMRATDRGYAPAPGQLGERLATLPIFADPSQPARTMPVSRYGRRVCYQIIEYDPILDSSNMGMDDWLRLARDIGEHYDAFDAFVILHGTDTMAYTASALSFLLEGLGKPVVLTGSQIPLDHQRNDGVDNLLGALTVAGHFEIPEVCIYFHHQLYRGNRSRKADARSLDAFESANYLPLAEAGVDLTVHWERVLPPPGRPLQVHRTMSPDVATLRLFPGIRAELVANFLAPPIRGLVLETFGAGNAPDNRPDLLRALREASERGVVIVNTTQCHRGNVQANYAAGTALLEAGVVSGADMTPEAALTKLSFLLGQGLPPESIRSEVCRNLRGELTAPRETRFNLRERRLVAAVARLMSGDGEVIPHDGIRAALAPVLACAAAALGDIDALTSLLDSGVAPSAADYDGRTPLHLAASEGQLVAVQLLVSRGADTGAKDRWGATPLDDAHREGHELVVGYLTERRG